MRSRKVLIIAAVLVLVVGTAVGVGVYFIIQMQSLSHPPEDTAKFLPSETSFYFSMNLRPGAGQLMKARDIVDLFKENPKFGEKLDGVYEDIEEETGINVEEDLFPWLGPEIAVAVPTFEGIDEAPEFVAFIGATDTAAAESFLRKLIAFGEETTAIEYEEGVTRGHLTFVFDPSDDFNTHIALTDDYIVIATGAEMLESTLDRMDSGQDRPSLFDNPGFQEAREAAESPRFGLMYVDAAGIIDRLEEGFDEEVVDSLEDFSDQLPDFIVASSSFIDEGILVSTSFDYPIQDQLFVPAVANSVGSAGRAPADTVALLSFVGVQEAWERVRDEVGDLPDIDLDEVFDEIETEIGVDVDQDIFGWMTGELAFAMLLPEGVSFSTDEIHANVYVESDDRAKALSSLEKIQAALEDGGVEFQVVDMEGTDAVVVDLGDEEGLPNLTPGYVVLEDYVVIGTTLVSLQQAIEAERGDIPSLRETSAFSRPLAAAGNSTDLMIYGDIRRIVKEVLDQLDETDLEQYGDTADPFVEPLEAFLLGVEVEEDLVTFSMVVTFAAQADAPTTERTAALTSRPTATPIPAPTEEVQASAPSEAIVAPTMVIPTIEPTVMVPVAAPRVEVAVAAEPLRPAPATTPPSYDPDRDVLVALYNATGGVNWSNDTNWLSDAPLQEWHGVTTDANGRVTRLVLRSNQLSGEIPPELGGLSDLTHLSIWGNQLTGELPQSLTALTALEVLVFFNNPGLCASVGYAFQTWLNSIVSTYGSSCASADSPEDRAVLAELYRTMEGEDWRNDVNWLSTQPLREWHGVTTDADGRVTGLFLFSNELSGEIPPAVGNLTILYTLDLSDNRLSGEIPPELGSLSNLQVLILRENRLSGEIPPDLRSLSNLQVLILRENRLNGCIPEGLREVTQNDLAELGLPDCGM